MIVENELKGRAGLRLVSVVPEWIIPAAAVGDLLSRQAEQKEIFFPASAISMVAPSRVPMVRAPFIMSFILLVPLAS